MKRHNNMRILKVITIAYLVLSLVACGNDENADSEILSDAQRQEQITEGTSGIVLEQGEKEIFEDEEQNFESAYEYTNFEKRIMAISRLTEPED